MLKWANSFLPKTNKIVNAKKRKEEESEFETVEIRQFAKVWNCQDAIFWKNIFVRLRKAFGKIKINISLSLVKFLCCSFENANDTISELGGKHNYTARYLSISISICLFQFLSLRVCFYLYMFVSIFTCLFLSLCVCFYLYVFVSISACLFLSLWVFLHI